MNIWNQDNFIKAWNFASQAHKGQFIPGADIPYINHIGNVVMEVMAVIAQDLNIENPDLLVQCALLHDVIEDTGNSYKTIKEIFGVEVADGVSALSKDANLPSKAEQMQDSIARIRKQPKEIWMVKLADRITNLQPPPKHWNKAKVKNYRNEAVLILEKLGEANPYLAQRLKKKIAEYG
ncbi:HD domain-containing protein [Desulfococcaceae bacterium HSG7]|nr:HD domain-containing protein [Desulfococcaceae bacterium HSG7]